MKHGTVILIVLLLVFTAGACGGDGQSNDAPPWGLDGVDMPDTEAQVAAVFAALPEEIVGRTRLGDEPTHFGYIDEGSGSFWTIQADPWELQQALHMPGGRQSGRLGHLPCFRPLGCRGRGERR